MIEIVRIGKNSTHDAAFHVNRPQGHPVYLLLLVKTPAKFWVNGSWQTCAPNSAVIFKPGQMHWYCAADSTYINDWIHFRSSTDLLEEHFPFGQPISLRDPDDHYALFHLIYKEYYGATNRQKQVVQNLTAALLNKIYDESNTKAYPDIYYLLAGLREQIYQFPAKQWNAATMAARLNISTGYLHMTYRQYFNTTCMADVIQSRIQYACELLASNHKKLHVIAQMCGYHSVEHFMRQFKAVTGTTPGEYRKSYCLFSNGRD